MITAKTVMLSLHYNGHFPGGLGLADSHLNSHLNQVLFTCYSITVIYAFACKCFLMQHSVQLHFVFSCHIKVIQMKHLFKRCTLLIRS